EIIEVNEELEDSPELINESPYDEGWIGKIKPSYLDSELGNLMKISPEFEKFIDEESKKHSKED
ncbi:MAG: glycine cleavage system protein H, partial [Actinomycetia bacterium]|nr:glycine cleavage system protein H [Actinomycetes bacterium]